MLLNNKLGLWLPDRFYAAGDLNSGGGRAGTAETDNYALDKPYDTGNSELDEMLNMLFRGLTRTRTTTTSLSSLITSLQSSLASVQLSVSGLSTGGLPGILNQRWYAFLLNAGTAGTKALIQMGDNTVAPILTTSGGGQLDTWTHNALSTGQPWMLSESAPALTAAQSIYFGTASSTGTTAIQAIDNPLMDAWFGPGTPTGVGTGYKVWVGLFNTTAAPTFSSDTAPTTDFAAIRYSSAAGDSKFTAVVRDNSTTNTAVISGSAAFAFDTPYHFRIRTPDAGVTWYFSVTSYNGTTLSETTLTTNVPRTTQNLFPFCAFHKEATGLTQQGKCWNNRIIVRYGVPVALT